MWWTLTVMSALPEVTRSHICGKKVLSYFSESKKTNHKVTNDVFCFNVMCQMQCWILRKPSVRPAHYSLSAFSSWIMFMSNKFLQPTFVFLSFNEWSNALNSTLMVHRLYILYVFFLPLKSWIILKALCGTLLSWTIGVHHSPSGKVQRVCTITKMGTMTYIPFFNIFSILKKFL